ncbi:hypothetical protein C8R45DRAFT_1104547 [Mycena sanguinolenta]|nr:hypothetical protein C8R45DRAFT_1104547 [Mycena sanguinolenta]
MARMDASNDLVLVPLSNSPPQQILVLLCVSTPPPTVGNTHPRPSYFRFAISSKLLTLRRARGRYLLSGNSSYIIVRCLVHASAPSHRPAALGSEPPFWLSVFVDGLFIPKTQVYRDIPLQIIRARARPALSPLRALHSILVHNRRRVTKQARAREYFNFCSLPTRIAGMHGSGVFGFSHTGVHAEDYPSLVGRSGSRDISMVVYSAFSVLR